MKFLDFNNKYFLNFIFSNKNKLIYIAYSGGVDSRILLELIVNSFNKKNYIINVFHISYNLDINRLFWISHCKLVCNKLNVNFFFYKINLKKKNNIEEKARIIRFNFLKIVMNKNSFLFLGHNFNDKIETIFYRLFRGSGLLGIGGMKFINIFYDKQENLLIRPLIYISKSEIIKFAKKQMLCWILDYSNFNIDFDRNFLRHKILPLIGQRWPTLNLIIDRFSFLSLKSYNFIYFFIKCKFVYIKNNFLNISFLLNLPRFLRLELIRSWILEKKLIIPYFSFINNIEKNILLSRFDFSPVMYLKNYNIKKYRNLIYLNKYYSFYLNINVNKNIFLKFNKKFLYLSKKFFIRIEKKYGKGFKLINNYYYISNEKYIKFYIFLLKKNNIPPWNYFLYPCIFYNKDIVSIVGIWINKKYKVDLNEKGIVLSIISFI